MFIVYFLRGRECVCVCFVSWEDREILVGNWERSMNLMDSAVFWYFKQLLSK